MNQKQILLAWSASPTLLIPPLTFSPNELNLQKHSALRSSASVDSVNETQLTARERRELRKERRERNPAYNWKAEVEEKLLKKPKKRYLSWTEELNLDNLALMGPQWWVVRVSRVSSNYTAELLARSLARNFPSMDFKVFIPSVQIKKILKNGTVSVKPKSLFPGCVFLRSILNKEVHDFIRECDGIGGFVGSRVGNTKRQINLPRPVDPEDMEAVFKQVKEEQEAVDQAFLEENQGDETLGPETSSSDSNTNSVHGSEPGAVLKPKRQSRKAKTPASAKDVKALIPPGSTVQIVSGAFTGYSGVLKKHHAKRRMVTVGFTLFGKETLADLDINEVVAETN